MDYRRRLVERLRERAGLSKPRLLFIDGDEPRALEAAKQLVGEGLAEITLLVESGGSRQEGGIGYLDIHQDKLLFEELVGEYVRIRRGKESEERARELLTSRPYFGALLLKLGRFDGAIGGLLYTTSDILRAGFKVIGPREGVSTISSSMLMIRGEEAFIFSDISVNPSPDGRGLAEIGLNAANFARKLGIEPKVAYLSFSTAGSASHPSVELVREGVAGFKALDTRTVVVGELQFDAAFDSRVRVSKYGEEVFEGAANVYIFPDLNSGNIGYKIAQRLGGYLAVGPVITGIALPFNDLSRGAKVEDVYLTAILTALDSY